MLVVLPTPLEDEVLVGLLTLTRLKNNFTLPRVEFHNSELYDLMGWPHNGSSNTRLGVALDRLALKYIRATLAGEYDRSDFAHEVAPTIETPEQHGRCPHCA